MIRLILFYAASTGLQKGIVFLASLLLVRVFAIEDIGFYVLVQTVGQLIVPILTLNLTVALMRESKQSPFATRRLLALSVRGIFVFLACACFVAGFVPLPGWMIFGAQLGITESLFGLAMAVLQGRECVNIILKLSLSKTGGFALVIGAGYLGYLSIQQILGLQLVLGLLVDIVSLKLVFNLLKIGERENKAISIREMISYSVATLPHTAALWLGVSSDRLIIGFIMGKAAIGGYAIAYTMAQMVTLLLSGVITAVPPRIAAEPDIWRDSDFVVQFVKRVALASFGIILLILLAWKINANYLHIIPPGEPNSYILISIIGVGFSFSIYYVLFASYMYLNRETSALKFMGLWLGPINLILMYLFITEFGTVGAGIGLICVYISFGIGYGYMALRLEPSLKLTLVPLIRISFLLLISSIATALLLEYCI